MDNGESTHHLSAGQGVWPHQKRDGTWVVIRDEGSVSFIDKLTIVPDRTAFDRFEDALSGQRDALEHAVWGAIAAASPEALKAAFCAFDYEIFHVLEALREALKL